MSFVLSKNTFSFITTSKKGSIFTIETSSNVIVKYCIFNKIISTSNPGCFYVSNSKFNCHNSLFTNCRASGGDAKFGNAFYCESSSCEVNNIEVLSCTESRNSNACGDSAIELKSAAKAEGRNSNFSKNYSYKGASSFSVRDMQSGTCYISYINIVDCIDHNSLETSNSQDVKIKECNFVNTTKNDASIINNPSSNILFDHCVFIKSHTTFSSNSLQTITFNDCIADTNCVSGKMTLFNGNSYTLRIDANIFDNCKTFKRNYRSNTLFMFMVFLVIY